MDAAHDQPQNPHPVLVQALHGLVKQAKAGEIEKGMALERARVLIDNFARTMEQQALLWLQHRTGRNDITILPPEQQVELERQRELYVEQFKKILDDAVETG